MLSGCSVRPVPPPEATEKILLALLDAFFFVGAGDRVLEAGRVGRVAGDRNVDAFQVHDRDAFADIVGAVAADLGPVALRVGDFLGDGDLAGGVVELGLAHR